MDKTVYYCYFVSDSGKMLSSGYTYASSEREAMEHAEEGNILGTINPHNKSGKWVITTEPLCGE